MTIVISGHKNDVLMHLKNNWYLIISLSQSYIQIISHGYLQTIYHEIDNKGISTVDVACLKHMNLTPSIVMTSIVSSLQVFKPEKRTTDYTCPPKKGGLSLSPYGLVSYRKCVLRVELLVYFGFRSKIVEIELAMMPWRRHDLIWHCHPFTTNSTCVIEALEQVHSSHNWCMVFPITSTHWGCQHFNGFILVSQCHPVDP